MKRRVVIAALALVVLVASPAVAQMSRSTSSDYTPRLGDLMNAIQSRHIKLWFAAKNLNWDLAAYELAQIKGGLSDAAGMYSGMPVSNLTTMSDPLDLLAAAIKAKDGKKFAASFGTLTAGCNACHQTMERGFVVIQQPVASPFSNQSFAPAKK
ncbi:hypothetical protein [Rhodopseudomonas sp. RCAM05734]|uniref:hypothetical protein n=1 Tax=Rhodopseudomonas sp. RCAM05734 TaxID=3457549 RepID=UPI0040442974